MAASPELPGRALFIKKHLLPCPPSLLPKKPSQSQTPEPSGDRVFFGSSSQLCFIFFWRAGSRASGADSQEPLQAEAGNSGQLRQTGSRHISFYLEIQAPHSSAATERSAVYQIKSLSLSPSLKPNTLTWVLAVTLFN